ncbi:hypothetical protein A9P82_08255 [Arachidicoccus ginsenosidimutans]|uniref:hypothetical protein n=1 Tax=Arachidicoccus sp. BS20 TaxID=1850526 RepID=UPI0007F150B3|nr:hypothetical protein [Arachidicoccus sp. BS20]ANI89282.1 hypothetical protein A9P82_08255 [Arachidicoccus sp. BS20]
MKNVYIPKEKSNKANNAARIRKVGKQLHKDIKLNLGVKECIIRFVITLFVPWIPCLLDKRYIVYALPVMCYLLFTVLTHFCPIKYLWHHVVKHEPDPEICPWAKDLNIEVEHL